MCSLNDILQVLKCSVKFFVAVYEYYWLESILFLMSMYWVDSKMA